MSTITAQASRVPGFVPMLNPLMTLFIRLGVDLGPRMALITVRGRKSGDPLTTPVTLFDVEDRCFIFGTFGNTSWVRNARRAGELILTRGRQSRRFAVVPVTHQEAVTVLRGCLTRYSRNPLMVPMLRRFYGIGRNATGADFDEIARHHPGFELRVPTIE